MKVGEPIELRGMSGKVIAVFDRSYLVAWKTSTGPPRVVEYAKHADRKENAHA